jgi:hypothetical protein
LLRLTWLDEFVSILTRRVSIHHANSPPSHAISLHFLISEIGFASDFISAKFRVTTSPAVDDKPLARHTVSLSSAFISRSSAVR